MAGIPGRFSLQAGDRSSSSTKSSNPSDYGYMYSAERAQPPPEVGWKDKSEGEVAPVNLYSENVVKEGDTTETIDRESIANLSSMKQRWESIFSAQAQAEPESSSASRQKPPPKWEVRLPYSEKPTGPPTVTSESESAGSSSTESAIEREIRLAHEREEILKREKAEQIKQQVEQQQQHQQYLEEREESQREQQLQHQTEEQHELLVGSYEAAGPESEFYQPEFEELAEADRGHDLWAEGRGRMEPTESNDNLQESFIEREIRQQQEREAELARLRQGQHIQEPKAEVENLTKQETCHDHAYMSSQQEADVAQDMVDYVPHIDFSSHGREDEEEEQEEQKVPQNFIAIELQQLQEREEEFRRTHNFLNEGAAYQTTEAGQRSRSSISEELVSPAGSKRDSVVTSPSPSPSLGSSIHSNIAREEEEEETEKPNYFCKQETPIQREMRIAMERENDLRRQKGLPEISFKPDDEGYVSHTGGRDLTSPNTTGVNTPRSSGADPRQKFASNRLQKEIQQQKARELALCSEGKIKSTSEDNVQPVNFMNMARADRAEGHGKRNFESGSARRISVTKEPEVLSTTPTLAASSDTPPKRSGVAAGGKLFSYREFRQTAESRIEQELRDLREREQELKNLRLSTKQEGSQKD